jgi:hypothetical protein
MSLKNRVSENHAANLMAPFRVPRRKGMVLDGCLCYGSPQSAGLLAICRIVRARPLANIDYLG